MHALKMQEGTVYGLICSLFGGLSPLVCMVLGIVKFTDVDLAMIIQACIIAVVGGSLGYLTKLFWDYIFKRGKYKNHTS